MARHSHWHQIRLKKGAADQKRGKIFTRHARLIEMATRRGGGDEKMNPTLASAIENARGDNMPRDNIDRAIKKALGEGKDEVIYEEVVYEGFGPGGVAILVEALTDNKNRTNQTVRLAMSRHGGNLGSSGATGFLFDRKGEIIVKKNATQQKTDENELAIIDAGAEDIQETDEGYVVYTAPQELTSVRSKLANGGFLTDSSRLVFVPKNVATIEDPNIEKKLMELIELLEAEDDITNVWTNL